MKLLYTISTARRPPTAAPPTTAPAPSPPTTAPPPSRPRCGLTLPSRASPAPAAGSRPRPGPLPAPAAGPRPRPGPILPPDSSPSLLRNLWQVAFGPLRWQGNAPPGAPALKSELWAGAAGQKYGPDTKEFGAGGAIYSCWRCRQLPDSPPDILIIIKHGADDEKKLKKPGVHLVLRPLLLLAQVPDAKTEQESRSVELYIVRPFHISYRRCSEPVSQSRT